MKLRTVSWQAALSDAWRPSWLGRHASALSRGRRVVCSVRCVSGCVTGQRRRGSVAEVEGVCVCVHARRAG